MGELADSLANPGPVAPPLPKRTTPYPDGWQPRSEIDMESGGYIVTPPSTSANPPDAEKILRDEGLDPAAWVLRGFRRSRWQHHPNGEWLYAYRVQVVPVGLHTALVTDRADLIGEVAKWKPRRTGHHDHSEATFTAPIGDTQIGKALADDTPVLTPQGWRKHGELRPGDEVYGPGGRPVQVLAVTGSTEQPLYEVRFDRGVTITATGDHLWSGWRKCHPKNYRHGGPTWEDRPLTWTTSQIAALPRRQNKNGTMMTPRAFQVPVTAPLDFPDADLPIDPYVLGLWLGDGNSRTGIITLGAEDAGHITHLGHHVPSNERDGRMCSIRVPGLTADLRRLGLLGNKHIPDVYLYASPEQRRALLQGLLDTDGYCSQGGVGEFVNTNLRIAEGADWLLTSLGYKVTRSTHIGTLDGVGHREYLRLQFPTDAAPLFRFTRKWVRQNHDAGTQARRRFVQEVVEAGTGSAQCITVEGGLYLAGRDLVVTHNCDGDGTEGTVRRFLDNLQHTVDRYTGYRRRPETVLLPWLGDCIEGIWSQSGALRMRLDQPPAAQVRIYRRLMARQIKVMLDVADRVVVPVIPGNHDETIRVADRMATSYDDSWAVDGASAVQDGLAENPDLADRVEFLFPGTDDLTVVGAWSGVRVGMAHGHQFGRDPLKWWDQQAGGRTPVGEADLLLAAHLHHLRIQDHGGARLFLQIPALDGGSVWFQHKYGQFSPSRTVTFLLDDGRVRDLDPVL